MKHIDGMDNYFASYHLIKTRLFFVEDIERGIANFEGSMFWIFSLPLF